MPSNEHRAERAFRALLVFHQWVYGDSHNPDEEDLIDLLTDLRHLSDQYAWDFDEAVVISEGHHTAEVEVQ